MLASSSARLDQDYDVVIVGSGYGGAIIAARLGVGNHQIGGQLRQSISAGTWVLGPTTQRSSETIAPDRA